MFLATGSTANTIVAAREGLLAWIVAEIEKVVGDDNAPGAEHEIETLALSILVGKIMYAPMVKILGCTKPTRSDRTSVPLPGSAKWGEVMGKTRASDTKAAVTELETILSHVWGDGAGCDADSADGSAFGLLNLTDASVVLDDEGAETLFNEASKRIDAACRRMRTRDGAVRPNWLFEVELAKKTKLEPLFNEKVARGQARKEARSATAELLAELGFDNDSIGSAGGKRKLGGQATKGAGAAAAAAAAAAATSDTAATSGAAAAATRNEKRNKRSSKHAAAKAAEADTAAAAAADDDATELTAAQIMAAATAKGLAKAPAPGAKAPTLVDTRVTAFAGVGGRPLTKPNLEPEKIKLMVDKDHHLGAVEAFEWLFRQQSPNGPMPCGFANLASCRDKNCGECGAQTKLRAAGKPETPVPPDIIAKVKAACVANLAARIG